jgi:hypothetical protein
MTLRGSAAGKIPETGRGFRRVEMRQELKDAMVNGREGQDITITLDLVGIQGELRDYLLQITYATVPGDLEVDNDVQTLQSLVASFRPLKIGNEKEKKAELAALADDNYKKLMATRAGAIFEQEFALLMLRLKGADLDDHAQRHRALTLLKPFQIFAHDIDYHDETLDPFWPALEKARVGDATEFKAQMVELIQLVSNEPQKQPKEPTLLLPTESVQASVP